MKNTFKNLQKVRQYLLDHGYKISKSQLYDHGKAGKIKPRQDGEFYQDDIDEYAAAFLKTKAGGRPISDVQNRRNEAEARKMEAQARLWRLKADILAGQYIKRDSFELDLTSRSLLFKHDLQNLARAQAPTICRLVNGDRQLIPELMDFLLEQFAIFLNRYAEDREFVVPSLDENDDESISGAENDD